MNTYFVSSFSVRIDHLNWLVKTLDSIKIVIILIYCLEQA